MASIEVASAHRATSRNHFLSRIREGSKSRQVLVDLAEAPCAAFLETPANLRRSYSWRPQASALREALTDWSRRWHLETPWCVATAFETIDHWDKFPWLRERLEWCWLSSGWMVEESPTPPPAWTPDEARGIREARRAFEEYAEGIRAELAAREAAARAAGLPVEPANYKVETIDRAVRFQVLGEPLSRIADDRGKDIKTVRVAVFDFLDFIGLPRRLSAKGRPRGSRNQAGLSR